MTLTLHLRLCAVPTGCCMVMAGVDLRTVQELAGEPSRWCSGTLTWPRPTSMRRLERLVPAAKFAGPEQRNAGAAELRRNFDATDPPRTGVS